MNRIDLDYASLYYSEPIVYITYEDGFELGFPEMKELISAAEKLSGNMPYVTLSDVRVKIKVTEQGLRYISRMDHMPFFRGTAALVKNDMLRLAANFLGHFQKSAYPFKAFTSETKALAWLKKLPLD